MSSFCRRCIRITKYYASIRFPEILSEYVKGKKSQKVESQKDFGFFPVSAKMGYIRKNYKSELKRGQLADIKIMDGTMYNNVDYMYSIKDIVFIHIKNQNIVGRKIIELNKASIITVMAS